MTKKKGSIILLSWLLIINLIMPTFANYTMGEHGVIMEDLMTGETGEYTIVNLMMRGADVITDVPAIYYTKEGETRTLVPVSFIAGQMGMKVDWIGATKEVVIASEDKEIIMQIGNPKATVNGKVQDLPSQIPPMLMSYDGKARTMVPVAFITEIFGLDVDWDGETDTVAINKPAQTISNVYLNYKSKFPEIRFKTSGQVDATSYKVNGSQVGAKDKILVDFQNTTIDLAGQIENQYQFDKLSMNPDGSARLEIGGSLFGIESVDINQIDGKPGKTRVEITLLDAKGYDVYYDAATGEMVIQFINTLNGVTYEKIYNADAIAIDTSEYPAYNKVYEDGRLIIDVINAKLKANEGQGTTEILSADHMKSVTYQSWSDDALYGEDSQVSRVAIDLADDVEEKDIFTEVIGQSIFVYVATEPRIGYDYTKGTNTSGLMTLSMLEQGNYESDYDEATRELTIKVAKDKVNLQEMTLTYGDNVLDQVAITEDRSDYKIKVHLEEGTSYTELSSPNRGMSIQFSFANLEILNSKNQDIIVVVDPGHGGHDPGAIGSMSKEKDLNLQAGLMLRKSLERQGYKVYMTREVDKYVDLYEIADIANELGADYFISIHINASVSSKPSGVEILHGSTSESGSYGMAKEIQKLIPGYLNAVDRGTSLRPELAVLRRTKMPAVLCELGFISNKEEEARLNNPDYLQRAVDAIVDGFENYLEKYN